MELIYIDPKEIKIKGGLDRIRKDMGDVRDLAESIRKLGQIVPIIINRENELIDGGRRLAACLLGDMQVKAIYEDFADPLRMRQWEIEANIKRKQFTPAEECFAIEELHKLKVNEHGMARTGQNNEGWRQEDTAELIGKTRPTVTRALELAQVIRENPELMKAKKTIEIVRMSQKLQRADDALRGLAAIEINAQKEGSAFELVNADAFNYLKGFAPRTFDLILTDPPYGIEINKMMMSGGGIGSLSIAEDDTFQDKFKSVEEFYLKLGGELFRISHEQTMGYCFVAPDYFWTAREAFREAGWLCYPKPMIWIKNETGQTNTPRIWPASCYEMILYFRRTGGQLVQEGMPDWVQAPPLNYTEKIHMTEKPVRLLEMLLKRISLPGQKIIDPFVGSGSSIEAALNLKLQPYGSELSKEYYALAMNRLSGKSNGGEDG